MYPMPKLTTIALNSGLEYSDKSPLDQIIHTIIIQWGEEIKVLNVF